jgi:5-methyltetrahydropteroyltriglutamate--homocysteine methyltransferase
MARTHVLGFPRIGRHRELKFALEAYWAGRIDQDALRSTGRALRAAHWQLQREAGLDWVCVGDFAWYDHVHTITALTGNLPARFGGGPAVTLDDYFAMARGTATQPALEMTKWFDTNYHYLVPEFGPETRFRGNPEWLLPEVDEALAAGHPVKVCLLGPVSYLWLGKSPTPGFDRLSLLGLLINVYWRLLQELAARGVEWVQLDEPILALDLPEPWLQAYEGSYRELASAGPRLLLASGFGDVSMHRERLERLPIAGLHLDAVRAPGQLQAFADWPADRVLSVGVVDGRNIWRNDLVSSLALLHPLHAARGEQLWVGSSCSLLHVPVDLESETRLQPELRSGLAFARQKAAEIGLLGRALRQGEAVVWRELAASAQHQAERAHSPHRRIPAVRQRVAALKAGDTARHAPYAERSAAQHARLALPLLPTTTIGSFPQTAAIREARARFKRGELSAAAYEQAMRDEIAHAVRIQSELEIDVLVHGEAERNDMVEYFGEQLQGYAFTANGWVQSYGSRCVKPPLIHGDVWRPAPMTVEWTTYAQSLTPRPLKGMLTGPVTMLQWAFVRDDLPRSEVALQIALALRDEVQDLEAAGIGVIQIDEPAFREGLPLRRAEQAAYLDWAVRAFRICSAGVRDETQIHTHMCYSEFGDILPAIAALDADVITIETSRSSMELLDAFAEFEYPNEIGPGIYDIHSPRRPGEAEMERLLEKALAVIPAERLWVNPDCGLKTRRWEEVEPALRAMMAVARRLRTRLETASAGQQRLAHPQQSAVQAA